MNINRIITYFPTLESVEVIPADRPTVAKADTVSKHQEGQVVSAFGVGVDLFPFKEESVLAHLQNQGARRIEMRLHGIAHEPHGVLRRRVADWIEPVIPIALMKARTDLSGRFHSHRSVGYPVHLGLLEVLILLDPPGRMLRASPNLSIERSRPLNNIGIWVLLQKSHPTGIS